MQVLYSSKELSVSEMYKVIELALAPVRMNDAETRNNGWDDYDVTIKVQTFCNKMIKQIENKKDTWLDIHMISDYAVVMFTGGLDGIKTLEKNMNHYGCFEKPDYSNSIQLSHFHITKPQRGIGKKWVVDNLFQKYKEEGFQDVYAFSTHQKAFSFYNRLGKVIGTYKRESDNKKFTRDGEIYKIPL